jgi:hypothetical protein
MNYSWNLLAILITEFFSRKSLISKGIFQFSSYCFDLRKIAMGYKLFNAILEMSLLSSSKSAY